VQDRLREEWEQRDRPAEQHGEQVERDRAEDHRRRADEADAPEQPVEPRRLGARALAALRMRDPQHHERRGDEQHDAGGVHRLGPDREEQAADRRPADRRRLPRNRPERDRTAEQLGRHDLRRQRATRRIPQRGDRAGERRERDELPELVRAPDGHDQKERDADRVGEADDRDERDARQPVGELPGREREERHGEELREADQSEVEGTAVDRVDLPADRDRDHLHCDAGAEHRRPESAEVAVQERRRQAEHASHSAFFGCF
jgi:hypothetical protein